MFVLSSTFSDSVINGSASFFPKLLPVLFWLLVGILAVRIFGKLTRVVLKLTNLPLGLRGIIASIIDTVLWIFLIIQVVQVFDPNIIVFFSSSALAIGIVLAAGGSTLLSDIVAGIFLVRDGDFNVGDEVIAGENRTQGVIESLDARRTRIRDAEGILHVIPNSVVERKEWEVVRKRQDIPALVKAVQTVKKLQKVRRKKSDTEEKT